jgi:CRISPR/Cas system CMR-associated protein Cmr5 small subunit
MSRRSADVAKQAYRLVSQANREIGTDAAMCRRYKARAQELPVRLHRSGLVGTAAYLDAKASDDDHRFTRNALMAALVGPHRVGQALTPVVADVDHVTYRELVERAATFSWWLKRAAEASWRT